MTDISEPIEDVPRKSLGKRLLPIMLPVLALGVGFGATYSGLLSPLSMLTAPSAPAQQTTPEVVFLDVPRIILTIPGERTQTLALAVVIDVEPAAAATAHLLMPRITDSFNGFLSQIDAAAFSRRGILEIIREELATRTRFILGDTAVRDLLITEFRIQ